MFINRDITRADLMALVRQCLSETSGNYRAVLRVLRMEPGDYKRFLNFLSTHDCTRRLSRIPVGTAAAGTIDRTAVADSGRRRWAGARRCVALGAQDGMSHFLRPLLARHPVAQALVNERTGAVVAETLETAFDSGTRRRGLLGRDDLAAGAALVLAPCNAVHTCRMRFPIDVVFVARDGRVTKIVRRLAAWRAAASFLAFATIELRAGTLEGADLTIGDRLVVGSPGVAIFTQVVNIVWFQADVAA